MMSLPRRFPNESEKLFNARFIAYKFHLGQKDKAGKSYMEHLSFVAHEMETEDEKIVAYLHDILEDTDCTEDDLLHKYEISEELVEAVVAITKLPNEPYDTYLKRVSENGMARRVKLKDILHNSDETRLPDPSKYPERLRKKYQKAYRFLSIVEAQENLKREYT